MKFYFAPMEGITGYVYRNVHHEMFPGITQYYAPFIAASQLGNYKKKEINDVLPENNLKFTLIPQVLTNDATAMIMTQKILQDMGYQEVNLNLGCPSGTVVAKGRGAGFLKDIGKLDQFFDEVFSNSVIEVSVKTRLGLEHPEEFYQILELYNKYPIKELIVHPRVRMDYYKNQPNLSMFQETVSLCKHPLGYNGNLFTTSDYKSIVNKFPTIDSVMCGRGLLHNPNLITEITTGEKLTRRKLREFHEKLYHAYGNVMQEENNVLFKMKELWLYMIDCFDNNEKYAKKIKKVQHCREYELIIANMFQELNIRE